MPYGDFITATHDQAVQACGEPIEAALLVLRSPDTGGGGGLKRLFGGGKTLAAQVSSRNYLALTPTHLRLFALGGRTGLVPKEEIAAWPRGTVSITTEDVIRDSYWASTGNTHQIPVHKLVITGGPEQLTVDVMAADPDDAEVLGDEPAREIAHELDQILAAAP